ncbi:MAG TPA: SOS response-associated peptidase [Hanamia sp.]
MCYYNSIKVAKINFLKLLEIQKEISNYQLLKPIQNGFDYAKWPILKPVAHCKDFEIEMAQWGFIPPWIKNTEELGTFRKQFSTLNAKSETILQSKMFYDASLKRRCLVLSSGFYEWRHYKPIGEKKEIAYPYFIHLPGKEYFYMAGLWQPWTDQQTGETFDTFTIVTTKANSVMGQVHNKKKRMPTILPEILAAEWISDNIPDKRIQEIASYQIPSELMSIHTLSKNFRTDDEPQKEVHYAELPPIT